MNLNQVTLSVNNMTAACDFYLTLGLTQIVETDHYSRFLCPIGEATLSLILTETVSFSESAIYFETPDLDRVYDVLVGKGLRFQHPPIDQPYLWREATLLDPSFNKIKLFWAGDNRVNPPWRVNIVEA